MNAEKPTTEESSALDWAVARGAGGTLAHAARAEIRRRRRLRRTAGWSAMVVVGFAAFLWWRSSNAIMEIHPAPIVALPDRRLLDDGSVIELRPGAEVAVHYSDSVRRVELLRGEVHFTVQKEAVRPFFVDVSHVHVRAIGTAFLVQLGETAVDVVVTEGRVAVDASTNDRQAPTSSLADAGTAVSIPLVAPPTGSSAQTSALTESELKQRQRWRVARLEFSGTPLAQVVALFNQYKPNHLALADSELGSVRVSGILRADDVNALLQLLAADHGIKAEWSGAEVRLHRDR